MARWIGQVRLEARVERNEVAARDVAVAAGIFAPESDDDEEEPPVLTSAGLAQLTPWRKMALARLFKGRKPPARPSRERFRHKLRLSV